MRVSPPHRIALHRTNQPTDAYLALLEGGRLGLGVEFEFESRARLEEIVGGAAEVAGLGAQRDAEAHRAGDGQRAQLGRDGQAERARGGKRWWCAGVEMKWRGGEVTRCGRSERCGCERAMREKKTKGENSFNVRLDHVLDVLLALLGVGHGEVLVLGLPRHNRLGDVLERAQLVQREDGHPRVRLRERANLHQAAARSKRLLWVLYG